MVLDKQLEGSRVLGVPQEMIADYSRDLNPAGNENYDL
jgi:hypothetical protein